MSTTTEHADHADHAAAAHDEHEPHSDIFYVKIAIYLALMTGAEVVLSYSDVGALFST